jgi:hypothetical protein
VTCVEFRYGSTSKWHPGIMSNVVLPFPDRSLVETLRDLHAEYVFAVNEAVADDRYDLVDVYAADYADDAAELMARVLPVRSAA